MTPSIYAVMLVLFLNYIKGQREVVLLSLLVRMSKTVHLYEYDAAELEAVWADITYNNIFVVVGSVYIAPGDMKALDILDTVIDNILRKHSCICTARRCCSDLHHVSSSQSTYTDLQCQLVC